MNLIWLSYYRQQLEKIRDFDLKNAIQAAMIKNGKNYNTKITNETNISPVCQTIELFTSLIYPHLCITGKLKTIIQCVQTGRELFRNTKKRKVL